MFLDFKALQVFLWHTELPNDSLQTTTKIASSLWKTLLSPFRSSVLRFFALLIARFLDSSPILFLLFELYFLPGIKTE